MLHDVTINTTPIEPEGQKKTDKAPQLPQQMRKKSPKKEKVARMLKDILIVEDNENNAQILTLVVQQMGYPAFVAGNAEEALEYCQTHTPRLVLMDLGLPDLDGIELTNRLKRVGRLDATPFIAVTAHAHARVKDLAMEAGCMQYITKPFMPSELMEQINQTLEGK